MPHATPAKGYHRDAGDGKREYTPSIFETVPIFVEHFMAHHRKAAP